ncbi:hypothetical protein CEXT_208641 [Caerostris extrusa]|uniref:Uncharacterized protein n=1 Tax=Caerostris extrusa TaxID=172846 RepID=A0AAV4P5C2_CAEEX|nr:hypothetical protein CEXT_208641 [Caerostris extrusa]
MATNIKISKAQRFLRLHVERLDRKGGDGTTLMMATNLKISKAQGCHGPCVDRLDSDCDIVNLNVLQQFEIYFAAEVFFPP